MRSPSVAANEDSKMSDLQTRVERIQAYFGYPFPPPLRQVVEERIIDDSKAHEEIDGTLVGGLVHWKGEQHDGPDPGIAAVAALFARLKRPVPPAALKPKPLDLLSRHFSGLFELRSDWVKSPEGLRASAYWVIDVNPRQDGKQCPVYRLVPGEPLPPYVCENPPEFAAWRAAVHVIESLDAEVEAAQKPGLLKALRERFPRPLAVEHERLVKRGILPAGDEAPVPAEAVDPEAKRLGDVVTAFAPVAEVMVARADGDRRHRLPAVAAQRALAVAGDARDWPPALLLRLQAHALSGNMDEARGEASRILDKHEGVPLTRRWADRIVRGLPPYES
jgi:hypothetical protein